MIPLLHQRINILALVFMCQVISLGGLAMAAPSSTKTIDLTQAVLVIPSNVSGSERKAAEMLIDEVDKRSNVRWLIEKQIPPGDQNAIVLGRRNALDREFPALKGSLASTNHKPEGYELVSPDRRLVVVAGNDSRGVLFGAGRLLRLLNYSSGHVTINADVRIETAPQYPLRGHQLGYRPKTNSYDGWNVAQWEQYIRDLVVFGANAIEGIPPKSDDDADSPHFPLPPMRMMIEQSRLAKEYGIEYWIWYPAIESNYQDPSVVDKEVKEWGDVLRQLPQVDAVFVPAGDPGDAAPRELFALMKRQAEQLKQLHPGARMWMSPQAFDGKEMQEFNNILKSEPTWLEGIAYGPQQRVPIAQLREMVPKRYKLRFYPDITHSLSCQFPVPNWDYGFAVTENREPINPRPRDQAAIFRRYQPTATAGVLTYSEGCNDDVNKCVWSSLSWHPATDVTDILRDYSRYFIGPDYADDFAQGLLALENNWRGSATTNEGIDVTLAQFREMERTASPKVLSNWRFQQALYRAYYDALVRAREIAELAQEKQALTQLQRAKFIGSLSAMDEAETCLKTSSGPADNLRGRVFELAEALYQSIHLQLSVPRYRAIAIRRGANLDLIDTPLNNAAWSKVQFKSIRAVESENERLKRIDEIVNWSNPGPGGFYDDLGNPTAQPHLVVTTSYEDDPDFLRSPSMAVASQPGRRISTATYAQTLWEQPLEMRYSGLDRNARYKVRIIYGMESKKDVRLVANGKYEIHPMRPKGTDERPVEFPIPSEATANGDLRLTWTGPAGRGNTGRGVEVAEVWLIKGD